MTNEVRSNPLSSLSIPPVLLDDHSVVRSRPSPSSSNTKPYALITTKPHPTLPLAIHNYNSRAFWSSSHFSSYSSSELQTIVDSPILANPEHHSLALTLACRSLVTHQTTGSVVARSFAKFFNFHEKFGYQPTGDEYAYEIEEKLDGSIIMLFWFDAIDHDPRNILGRGRGGQWVVASRASFDNPHTQSALNVLNNRYPVVLDTRGTILDKSKAYVFELIDPKLPIKVRYDGPADLAILAIISRDGTEPHADSEAWTKLPFRRPRRWSLKDLIGKRGPAEPILYPNKLAQLNRANEEGFVIKFWRTKNDAHPQRIKVKLDMYLKSEHKGASTSGKAESKPGKNIAETLAKISVKDSATSQKKPNFNLNIVSAPSSSTLVSIYTQHRLSILSFSNTDEKMVALKPAILQAIRDLDIMDDYGGEAWIDKISKTLDRIHALFSLNEESWRETVQVLEKEGHKPPSSSANPRARAAAKGSTRREFEKRMLKQDVDEAFKPALRAWYEGKEVSAILKLIAESLDMPIDLISKEVIVLE